MEGTNQVQDATICPVPGFIPQPTWLTEKRVKKTAEWGERQRRMCVADAVEWGMGKNKLYT